MTMSNDDLVSVLVPRALVTGVYAYIAGQLGVSAEQTSAPPEAEPEPEADSHLAEILAEWTPDIVQRMVRESPPAMRDILRVMANHPGQELSTEDVSKAIEDNPDADAKTGAGTFGAFARRAYNRYDKNTLPYEGRWDYEKHCKMHKMPKPIADEVLKALKQSE